MSLSYVLSKEFWDNEGDPRVTSYPMFSGGPQNMLTIMFIYLLFVKILGPFIMKNREPLELRNTMLTYNIFMVVINAWFLYEYIFIINFGTVLFEFQFPNRKDMSPITLRSIHVIYLYHLSKFVDLMDTIFFILRKKNSQITVLHLYHHFSVPTLGWLVVKIGPLVPGIILFAFLNTIIHVIMYSYYALSAFGPKVQKYLWWKRYLTQIQLMQFAILLIYCALAMPFYRGYRPIYIWIGASQPPLFLCLFLNFYIRSYKSKIGSYNKMTTISKRDFKTILKID